MDERTRQGIGGALLGLAIAVVGLAIYVPTRHNDSLNAIAGLVLIGGVIVMALGLFQAGRALMKPKGD